MRQSYDVIVVGAGPAGATLAYELARKGIGVSLLEKERLPRYKCCAGGISVRAARLLDFDISEMAEDVIYGASVTYKFGRPYQGYYGQPIMYTVMRDMFDSLLTSRARQAGARIFDGHKVMQLQMNMEGVKVSTSAGDFRSRFVVGADGAYSVVARELGMGRSIDYVAAIETEVAVPEEELVRWRSRIGVDLGGIPGGYAWVFPKRDHLSIGIACRTPGAKGLKERYWEFLKSLNISDYTITRRSGALMPMCGTKVTVSRDRAVLLGDAAGLTDPLSGEGIYNAVLSARLAAPVIEKSLAHDEVGLRDYQQAVEEKIMPEIRVARVASRIFVRFPLLVFKMLQRDDRAWRGSCYILRGETSYTSIKERAGGFKGIYALLSRR